MLFLARDFGLWLLLAVVWGVFIGWLWWGRSGAARRGGAKAPAVIDLRESPEQRLGQQEAELHRLRSRVAELEQITETYARLGEEEDGDTKARLEQAVLELVSVRAQHHAAERTFLAQLAELRRELEERERVIAANEGELTQLRDRLEATSRQRESPAPVDDLQMIDGLGARAELALRAHGIFTFDRLSEATPDELRKALEACGVGFNPSLVSWPEQAGWLARGEREPREPLVAWGVGQGDRELDGRVE